MRRALLTATCLLATSTALAASCPATEQEAASFVVTLETDTVVKDGGGQNTEYKPGNTQVLGVRPFFIQLQGVPALGSISRLRFDYQGSAVDTRAAFQQEFAGASCGESGECSWRARDPEAGQLEAVRTQDMYNQRITLLCDYN